MSLAWLASMVRVRSPRNRITEHTNRAPGGPAASIAERGPGSLTPALHPWSDRVFEIAMHVLARVPSPLRLHPADVVPHTREGNSLHSPKSQNTLEFWDA